MPIDSRYVVAGVGFLLVAAGLLTRAKVPSLAAVLAAVAVTAGAAAMVRVRSPDRRL